MTAHTTAADGTVYRYHPGPPFITECASDRCQRTHATLAELADFSIPLPDAAPAISDLAPQPRVGGAGGAAGRLSAATFAGGPHQKTTRSEGNSDRAVGAAATARNESMPWPTMPCR